MGRFRPTEGWLAFREARETPGLSLFPGQSRATGQGSAPGRRQAGGGPAPAAAVDRPGPAASPQARPAPRPRRACRRRATGRRKRRKTRGQRPVPTAPAGESPGRRQGPAGRRHPCVPRHKDAPIRAPHVRTIQRSCAHGCRWASNTPICRKIGPSGGGCRLGQGARRTGDAAAWSGGTLPTRRVGTGFGSAGQEGRGRASAPRVSGRLCGGTSAAHSRGTIPGRGARLRSRGGGFASVGRGAVGDST